MSLVGHIWTLDKANVVLQDWLEQKVFYCRQPSVTLTHYTIHTLISEIYKEGGVAQWIGRQTASPVMHASRVRTHLNLWGFQRKILVSPFSMWLGDHVNGGLFELSLRPVYRRIFRTCHLTWIHNFRHRVKSVLFPDNWAFFGHWQRLFFQSIHLREL